MLLKNIILLIIIPIVTATGGIFQIQIKQCCQQFNCTTIQKICPTKYYICVKNYQINIDNGNCYIGSNWINNNNTNELELNFEFKFRWTGTFSLIIESWNNDELLERVATQQYLDINNEWKIDEKINITTTIEYKYRVICLKNYYGNNCNKYCKARNDKFGHYYCEIESGEIKCQNGWEGIYCEKATCLTNCSPLHGYCNEPNECICHAGWHGNECSECKQYPGCKNGKCVKQWECECYEGWGGLFCNQDLNYCTNHKPCRNDGICFNTGQGSYTCECLNGWNGIDCEIKIGGEIGIGIDCENCTSKSTTISIKYDEIDFCKTLPCANGGTCINLKYPPNYICKCPTLFQSIDCSCNCNNNGICDINNNCICPSGYYGDKCNNIESNFTLGMIKQIISNEEELTNEHIIVIIISSISIPFLILFSISIIIIMRKKRLLELIRNERLAAEQNEINTINNVNKIKDLYMINNIYKAELNCKKNDLNNFESLGNCETIATEHAVNENLERSRRGMKNINYSYQPDCIDSGQSPSQQQQHYQHQQNFEYNILPSSSSSSSAVKFGTEV